jgi:hypothetical protein
MCNVRLAIHRTIKGKPIKQQSADYITYYVCDGNKVNLGYNWMNIDAEWSDVFELITTDGLATSAELNSDHRTDENFVSRQLIMVDIDDGMTIEQLFEDTFYNEYGAGFYATASHTDDAHRFRILFVTEEPITDREIMKKIMRGLLIVYKAGDTVCKDAARLYYGVQNCKIKERTDKILPKVVIDGLIQIVNELELKEEEKLRTKYIPDSSKEVDYEFVNQLLQRISYKVGDLNGSYEQWRPIAWATCHALGINNAQNLMMQYWPTKTKKHIQTLKSWKQQQNSPTVGTLIKLSEISKIERQLLETQMKLRNMK